MSQYNGFPDNSNHSQALWRPRVLVLDDEWSTLERIKFFLNNDFEVVSTSRAHQALKAMSEKSFDVVLTDMRMPDKDGLSLVTEMKKSYPESQYILMTAFSDIEDAISALRLGVADYLRKPFTEGEIRHALNRCLEHRRLTREVASLKSGKQHTLADVLTNDKRMIEICRLAGIAASTDVTVLISGETGTGKGVLARAIHNASPRSPRPFVEINCASIPATLIESELFGHEKGAFTGAIAKKMGRVETANNGTLVLDEIGEMPLDMQSKLLRFLQSFNYERIGGTKRLHADVRVIASTNRNLKQAVSQGNFRQDLFYRLHVIHLHIPPLRERIGDIQLLSENFLRRFSIKYNRPIKGISPQGMDQLKKHDWPGNVRELEHCLERSVILTTGSTIKEFSLPQNSENSPAIDEFKFQKVPDLSNVSLKSLADYMGECERTYLKSVLQKHQGRIGESAKAAGINPKTLYLKMSRYGLSRNDFKPNLELNSSKTLNEKNHEIEQPKG